jgi:superfamily I DNA/RNA helicase
VDHRTAFLEHPGIQAILAAFRLINDSAMVMDIQIADDILKSSLSLKALDILKAWAYRNGLSLKEALAQARRLPIPEMGRLRQQQLYTYTGKVSKLKERMVGLSVTETVEWLAKESGLMDKFSTDTVFDSGYGSLLETAREYKGDPSGFLAGVGLSGSTDVYDHRVEKVALMTMHAAKGLEFTVVFIAGCEDQWIPYHSVSRPADPEEERRLFYVAMTRAKTHLFLTRANRRRVNGKMQARQWSPFVKEIENNYKRLSVKRLKKIENSTQEQLSLF